MSTKLLFQHLNLLFYVCECGGLGQMILFTLSSEFLRIHHLDCGMVQHLLPGVVELPLAAVVEEPLLRQTDRLLRRRVYTCRSLELHRRLLTLCLGAGHLVHGLVVRSRLLNTVPQPLGQTLEVVGGVRQQLSEHGVGVVKLDLKSRIGNFRNEILCQQVPIYLISTVVKLFQFVLDSWIQFFIVWILFTTTHHENICFIWKYHQMAYKYNIQKK